MAHDDTTLFRGLSRREFLTFCGSVAALIGAGQAAVPEIASALESLAKRPSVVWSLFQECLGCSVNLLQSRTPGVAQLILQQISLDYHETVMAAAGFHCEVDAAERSERHLAGVVGLDHRTQLDQGVFGFPSGI